MQFLSRIADLIILNLLWLLCCVPVVTVGAATAALYRATLNMATDTDKSSLIRGFFADFSANWKQATTVWLIMLIPTVVIVANIGLLLFGSLGNSFVMQVACLLPTVILLCIYAYIFAYVAQFEDKALVSIKNSLLLSISNFPKTLLMICVNLWPIGLLFLTMDVIGWIVPYCFFVGGSLPAFLNSKMLMRTFRAVMPEEKEDCTE